MQVALIHRYYPTLGGVTNVVRNLHLGLLENGVENDILSNFDVVDSHVKKIDGNGIGFYFKLFLYLFKRKYDLIHTHSFPVCIFSPFIRRPIVMTLHSVYEKEAEIFGLNGIKQKVRYFLIYKLLFFLSLMGANKVICVSSLVSDELIKNYGFLGSILKNKIEIIQHPIDMSTFKSISKEKKKTKYLRVLLVGTNKRKGFDMVLDWAEILSRKNVNIRFIIIGKANVNPKIESMFEFIDYLPYEEFISIYERVDLVILPSRFDLFGMVALEAMASGRPVLVSKYCGAKDVVQQYGGGMVLDFNEFPQTIEYLSKNPDVVLKMGLKAFKAASQCSKDKIAAKYLEIYRKLLKGKNYKLHVS